MSKKFSKVLELSSFSNSKIITSCLGIYTMDYLSMSDESKQVYIYKRGSSKPIKVSLF